MEHYGEKLYKISLDAGFTCPNRDGTLGRRGCTFCSAGGSGEFAAKMVPDPSAGGMLDGALPFPADAASARRPLPSIRRGYDLSCFDRALRSLAAIQVPIIVHVILGLPGENRERMLETIRYLDHSPIFGIKLQLLHVLKGTDLAADYLAGRFDVLTMEAYLDLLADCIAALRPDIVVHRITGDGPKHLLIAPEWSRDKRRVLNAFHHKLKQESIRQGQCYESGTHHPLQIDRTLHPGPGEPDPDHGPDR